MSLKYKPTTKASTVAHAGSAREGRAVAGLGAGQGASALAYPMVLLLKKFLLTLKRGE